MPDERRIALVTTTINVPHNLSAMLQAAVDRGHAGRLFVVVVGDRKTPPEIEPFLRACAQRLGVRIDYLDVPAQQRFLRQWPALDIVIRYNCIQRRNVGFLWAARHGAEVLVSVDDDNFLVAEDFWGDHLVVGKSPELPMVSHPSGWWNVCERLACDPPRSFYHRGFPKSLQNWKTGGQSVQRRAARVMVNAGLWLNNPDVDATANIEEPLNVVSMADVDGSPRCTLAPGTWCPYNSQNTAFDVRTLPAQYLVVMLDFYKGYRVGRLDDIWASYFFRAIADAMGDVVAYGPPLVRQDRNPHNFVKDLAEELGGYILTEKLVKHLRSFKTAATDYLEAYLDLVAHLRDATAADPALDDHDREYFRQMLVGMAAWQSACRDVMPPERR